MLAKDGLPSGGSVGYEIFDRGDTFARDRLPAEHQRDPRAGGRTGAHHPRHPRRARRARASGAAAARSRSPATGRSAGQRAADHGRGEPARPEGVQAILNLVAAAVPGLRPQNIAIVDSRGDLLARAGEPVSAAAQR